jgi:hypothetical protein
VIFTRVWAMPSGMTFDIKPIKEFLLEHLGENWQEITVDPFPYPFKSDALVYLKSLPSNSADRLAFDPPFSPRQLKELYGSAGLSYQTNSGYWSALKKEIGRIMKKDGIVVSCGWNSGGIGKKYGFELTHVLLVPHGGQHNDTIVTCDVKV